MKFKILRNVTLGVGCLMLSLTLSSNLVHNNLSNKSSHVIQVNQEMPYGMAESKHAIHHMEEMPFAIQEMPYGMYQSKQALSAMQGMPYGMIQSI